MRIHLQLTRNQRIVPYNYHHILTGVLHKWLTQNSYHSQLSLYSFSWLKGGVKGNNGLYFPGGASWFISAYEEEVIKKLILGIRESPKINYGMEVTDIVVQNTPEFSNKERFIVGSPVFVKRSTGSREKHYVFSDEEVNKHLTDTLSNKLHRAGINNDSISVQFDPEYQHPKTKLIDYKGIKNKASVCPVIIEGTPEQIAFAWNVGVGNSTGIGFGSLN